SARVTRALEDNEVTTLSWSACSPNLSPIEHLGDQLMTAISHHLPPPRNRPELIAAAHEEWGNIP
ncbi:hypothetical protein CAPTEDRAFT_104372, partial [Capitella teleta]